jgi:hypothetical protein
VVGRAGEGGAGGGQAERGVGQLLARLEQQGEVVQPGMAPGWTGLGLLHEHHQVAPPRAQPSRRVVASVDLEAEDVLVEGDRAVEVGDRQVDGAQAQARRQRIGRSGGGGPGAGTHRRGRRPVRTGVSAAAASRAMAATA